ncbi:expressed unknown protein [Seminavis robusta]|uniref:Pyruvate carboxyltransferase domain-containing protein n=1 Tax=Seminavis robusta TaxID=568900 RepID=A0A9N8E6B5_9STRA|nr:expressed unknown protein [Seminavis robusta]|eukprot:Sro589_g171740.1 n/a (690) ;mRNA; f:25430-27667
MMAGYGICNAIIEIDTSVDTFDYDKYDIVERCRFLISWCKEHLPKRENVPAGEDNTARVFINLRDFSNYNRSTRGFEEALRLVHSLSSSESHQRPFGFMMEEPTGFLWPEEVGKLCRMIRLTMNRAGFPQGRFLVHCHYYFGLAEATQLTTLCNGADGVWAAVCKVGAQVGHASSTMTAVNLLRAGNQEIAQQFQLDKMCRAAREVTTISSRKPCDTHEEVYGEAAFDVPFMMTTLPACRFALAKLLKELKIDQRVVRLNEIIQPSAIYRAMVYHFGTPEEAGWDPTYCRKMYEAITQHLMTGLSRDYNSALGLGHLYGLVSQRNLPTKMINIMMQGAPVSDFHPTVLDFIDRWNRLCMKYSNIDVVHPASKSKSIMMLGTDVTVEPKLESLPFEFFLADVMRNPVLEPVPRLFKLQVVSLVTKNERDLQRKRVPEINFYEAVLRLKLFILEAESLGVLGLVDDFCIRKNVRSQSLERKVLRLVFVYLNATNDDYFFGEDHLWLQKVRGTKPRVLNKMLRSHIDFFPRHYMNRGNNAMVRCVRAAAKRIEENKGINMEMHRTYHRQGSARNALRLVIEMNSTTGQTIPSGHFADAHQQMLKELAQDEGQDEQSAAVYLKQNKELLGIEDHDTGDLIDAYLEESKFTVGMITQSQRKQKSAASLLIQDGLIAIEQKVETDGDSASYWVEV